jgi:hypothetical protein
MFFFLLPSAAAWTNAPSLFCPIALLTQYARAEISVVDVVWFGVVIVRSVRATPVRPIPYPCCQGRDRRSIHARVMRFSG